MKSLMLSTTLKLLIKRKKIKNLKKMKITITALDRIKEILKNHFLKHYTPH